MQLVEGDRRELVPEALVDLVAEVGGPGWVRLADGLLEEGVNRRVGELAVVAAPVGPVGVLVAGEGERPAPPGEVGDVEPALGQPPVEQDVGGGDVQAELDAGLGELGLEQDILCSAPWVVVEGGQAEVEPPAALAVDPVAAEAQPARSSSCLAAWVSPLPYPPVWSW